MVQDLSKCDQKLVLTAVAVRINFEIKVKVEAINSGLIVVSKGTVGLLVLVKPFLYL